MQIVFGDWPVCHFTLRRCEPALAPLAGLSKICGRRSRARDSRDITVPIGIARTSATWAQLRSSTDTSSSTLRCSSGREYYRLLQEVREYGNWEAWLDFFLTGVADTANQAFEAATRIVDLFKEDREKITTESDRAGSALRIHELFQQNPFHTANQIVQMTGLSAPTVNAALADLERLGIADEVTGRKRGRVFSYRRYLAILSEGTDPLPAT